MKTMTEFSAFQLRETLAKKKEIHAALQTEGKPAEELEQAQKDALNAHLTEKYKLEGEKLELFLKALEVAEAKPRELENLKRVVVYSVGEGEKVPGHLVQRESHAFGAEYLASLRPQKQDRRESGGKHGKGKGKGRGKGGRDERRGPNRRDRDGSAPRNAGAGPGRDGDSGPRRDGIGGPRPEGANGQRPEGRRRPRRDGAGGPRRDGNRTPRQDLPPGHVSVDQAARAMKSTGIRPVEKPQTPVAPAAPTPAASTTSDSNGQPTS